MILLDATTTASPLEIIAGLIFILIGAALALGIYFLPTLIAYKRHATGFKRILVLNLLLGWTLVGWIITLLAAIVNPRRGSLPVAGAAIAVVSSVGQLSPDGHWRWDGQRWLPTA